MREVIVTDQNPKSPEITALVPRFQHDLPPEEQVLEFWRARRKKSTLAAYEEDLEMFRTFIGAPDTASTVRELISNQARGNRMVLAYANHLAEQGKGTATVRRRVYGGVAAVVSVANTLGLIPWRLSVPIPKVRALRDTKGPTDAVITTLLAEIERRAENCTPLCKLLAVRNRAMVLLMLGNGLRRGEVVGLDVEHVDLEKKIVKILGKGQVDRQPIPIAKTIAEALHRWIEIRVRIRGASAQGPLFVNHHGERLSGVGLYKILSDLAKDTEIEFPRPHGFRHKAITEVVKQKGAATAFMFARHSNMTMTMRYVDNLAEHVEQGAAVMDEKIAELEKKR